MKRPLLTLSLMLALMAPAALASSANDDVSTIAPAESIYLLAQQPTSSPVLPTAEVPITKPTPTPIPEGDIDAGFKVASDLFTAIKDKNWPIVISIALALLVWVFRSFIWKSLSKEWTPIATAGVAMAGYISGGLAVGSSPWLAVGQGFMVGVGAVGSYQLYKAIRRLIKGEKKE